MSVPERLPSPFAALSDKELEILHLLTAGHTVKSIATRLGRSEASINERLRDARRKTGVGSSRELARLIDSQKNWDRNIDLPKPGSRADRVTWSPNKGARNSKGTRIMLIAIPIAAVGLMMAGTESMQPAPPTQAIHATAPRQQPLAGNWSLDITRIPAEERPRRVTIGFQVSQDKKWTTRVEIVAPDGTNQMAQSTAAVDGVPVSVSGNMDFIDTVSLRQPAPNTLVMTLGKNGAPVSTRVYTVAKDRKSMTETIIWANNGIPKLETTYFRRID